MQHAVYKIVIGSFLVYLPSLVFLLFAMVKALKAMKAEQRKIDFTVDVTCQECQHHFQVPFYVYSKHLFSNSKSVKKSASLGGAGLSRTQVISESRRGHCDQCQQETYCQWTTIDQFPPDYRKQITLAMIKGGLPYFLAAAVWVQIARLILHLV